MDSDNAVKLLVVDDHPENVLALDAILARPDYDIVAANCGTEALRLVLKHEFAVILLDVMMPQMDGFETARFIRGRAACKEVPIIFLTATGSDIACIYKGYALGAVDYLVKPIDPDIVRAKVAVFVDLFKKERRLRAQEVRLRDAERRLAQDRQRFLAEASDCLLRSLDFKTTLNSVAQLAVPKLADWCIVDLAVGNVASDAVAVAHAEAGESSLVHELRRRLARDPNDVVPKVFSTGRPQIIANAQRVGAEALMIVPLRARDQVIGTLTFASCSAAHRYDDDALIVAEDLAQRAALAIENARLYREVQEAVHTRDEFLSIASHELRTPLTPLQILFRRLLSERSKEPLEKVPREKLRSMLSRSEKQVLRLATLVDNLLDVARISSGRLQLEPGEVDLGEVAREVANRFSEELSSSGCDLKLNLGERVEGRWDRLRLEQVMTNLLGNAIKYGAGKPIEVTVTKENAVAKLSVRDHGIGIAADNLLRIFERFERAAPAHSYRGLGLGLYIARQIIDAHGGAIDVSSDPGQGSCFVVALPIAPSSLTLGNRKPSPGCAHELHPH